MTAAAAERWALVEVMGHRTYCGRISDDSVAGVPMLRVEVPRAEGGFDEHLVAGAALFALHPCTREQAMARVSPARPLLEDADEAEDADFWPEAEAADDSDDSDGTVWRPGDPPLDVEFRRPSDYPFDDDGGPL